jgi:tetratricopeptide (TPR) repeat protein
MNRHERRATVKKSQTVANGPGRAAVLYETGMGHLRAERYLDAQLHCQQALAADSDHADALHLMGLLSLHAQQCDLATEWITRAIRQDPKPQYLLSLGAILRQQGRLEEALLVFDKALQLKPDAAELWQRRANILVDLNRQDQALRDFQQALALSPHDRDAAYNCGSMLLHLERLEEAIACFDLCEQWQPGHWPTLQKRALVLYGLERFEEALADISLAHALDPTRADICNNAAIFLERLGRYDKAVSWFDRALERQPDYPSASTNKAATLTNLHRFAEAFAVYDEIKVRYPDHAEAEWGSSLLHLLTGNFEAGWAGREVRYKHPDLQIAKFAFDQPIWLGKEPIDGKTILIQVDEGLGDTIQFARYVPMVAAKGARVVLVVSDALCPLLSELDGVSQCLPLGSASLPAFDMYCPISSLPLAFGTTLETIPCATSYLPAPAEPRVAAWEARLGPHDRLRVGLVWSGNPKHKNDHNRSLPLRAFSSILDLDATFVSLQKDARPDDKATLREHDALIDPSDHLTDFVETSALISCLDLVITVDTSVAHLAGALGRPTWILLPYTPDYRWLLDREDSPWYPSARLFRQTESRDYASVLDRVRAELSARIAARS